MKHKEITERIIKCAFEVHKTLGNGFPEVIYQRALALEMKAEGLVFNRELEMPVFYRDERIGKRRVDFLVENEICTELKAVIEMEPANLAQGLNYLEAFNLQVGLLLNSVLPASKSNAFTTRNSNRPCKFKSLLHAFYSKSRQSPIKAILQS
jgi:GxxExxY protein